MDDKKFQEKLKNLVSHSQKISDVMTKINQRIEKWNDKRVFLSSTLDQIAGEINKSGLEHIELEHYETKSSIGLKLKPLTRNEGDGETQYIQGGHLVFSPTFHYRIASTYLEPYLSSHEPSKAQYLRDYDVEELNMDMAFKEVEHFMDKLNHFFQRGSIL
jgi:hypothetical protein